MIFGLLYSVILFLVACGLYTFHFLVDLSSFKYANEILSLTMGLALIGLILSTACFFMNIGLIKLKNRKRPFLVAITAVINFLLFVAFIALCLVERASAVGISF